MFWFLLIAQCCLMLQLLFYIVLFCSFALFAFFSFFLPVIHIALPDHILAFVFCLHSIVWPVAGEEAEVDAGTGPGRFRFRGEGCSCPPPVNQLGYCLRLFPFIATQPAKPCLQLSPLYCSSLPIPFPILNVFIFVQPRNICECVSFALDIPPSANLGSRHPLQPAK